MSTCYNGADDMDKSFFDQWNKDRAACPDCRREGKVESAPDEPCRHAARRAMDRALKNLGQDGCWCCECNGMHCMFPHEGHSCEGRKDIRRSVYRGVADLG